MNPKSPEKGYNIIRLKVPIRTSEDRLGGFKFVEYTLPTLPKDGRRKLGEISFPISNPKV